jgi:hypothetical protein
MTILPIELAERLNKFMKMDPANIINNKYKNYIMINTEKLISAADILSPIQLNLQKPAIYDTRYIKYAYYHKFEHIKVLELIQCNELAYGYEYWYTIAKPYINLYWFEISPKMSIINVKKINPVLLQYLIKHKLCVYYQNVPTVYACIF